MRDPTVLKAWMKKAGEGDQNAFRLLAQTLGSRMFGLSMRLCNGRYAEAQDVMQEALIKLWTSAPRWKDTGSVEAYVCRIVYRCCMDMHRKTRKAETLSDDLSTPSEQEDNMIQKQEAAEIMAAVRALPERQRQAILLTYFDERANKAVADILNVSSGAVESLLVRARRTLAKTLENSPPQQTGGQS